QDRSASADQPFKSPDGSVWLAGNGEIYNHRELRGHYPGYPFCSNSDLEVALPLLDESTANVERLEGKFALILWNNRTRELALVRDRAGENPLFYALLDRGIVVASEIQALLEFGVSRDLDARALRSLFALGFPLEPRTMFERIRRVPSGSIVQFNGGDGQVNRYWQPEELSLDEDAEGRLQSEYRRAVEDQIPDDLPFGVFLSGGLDSSLLVAVATRRVKVHTYTARFSDREFDESRHARSISDRFGTIHHEIDLDGTRMAELFTTAVERIAEPVTDPAIIPTLALAEEASHTVQVVLSGEGADELFGGYPTYPGHLWAQRFQVIPRALRGTIKAAVRSLPPSTGRVPLEFLLRRFVDHAEAPWLERHAKWFGVAAEALVRGTREHDPWGDVSDTMHQSGGALPAALLLDYLTYLRDNLLVKIDRATMLHSIEARSPYLDTRLTQLALSLPSSRRVGGVKTKVALRELARAYLPDAVIRRRKRGLSVPVARLINGALRGEVDRLLRPDCLAVHGLLNETIIRRSLYEHRNGIANHWKALWTATVFQAWYQRWIGGSP
ncbi:MAG: asparagine synthase (glutamine-hydrolyzing), partial [Gemmatimonadales bacterium]